MTNTAFKAMNFEELDLVTGGELDVEVSRDDNWFTITKKTFESKACKEVWGDIRDYAKDLGKRALGTAALKATAAWETVKRWF